MISIQDIKLAAANKLTKQSERRTAEERLRTAERNEVEADRTLTRMVNLFLKGKPVKVYSLTAQGKTIRAVPGVGPQGVTWYEVDVTDKPEAMDQ